MKLEITATMNLSPNMPLFSLKKLTVYTVETKCIDRTRL